jgi:hypothetical protein
MTTISTVRGKSTAEPIEVKEAGEGDHVLRQGDQMIFIAADQLWKLVGVLDLQRQLSILNAAD